MQDSELLLYNLRNPNQYPIFNWRNQYRHKINDYKKMEKLEKQMKLLGKRSVKLDKNNKEFVRYMNRANRRTIMFASNSKNVLPLVELFKQQISFDMENILRARRGLRPLGVTRALWNKALQGEEGAISELNRRAPGTIYCVDEFLAKIITYTAFYLNNRKCPKQAAAKEWLTKVLLPEPIKPVITEQHLMFFPHLYEDVCTMRILFLKFVSMRKTRKDAFVLVKKYFPEISNKNYMRVKWLPLIFPMEQGRRDNRIIEVTCKILADLWSDALGRMYGERTIRSALGKQRRWGRYVRAAAEARAEKKARIVFERWQKHELSLLLHPQLLKSH